MWAPLTLCRRFTYMLKRAIVCCAPLRPVMRTGCIRPLTPTLLIGVCRMSGAFCVSSMDLKAVEAEAAVLIIEYQALGKCSYLVEQRSQGTLACGNHVCRDPRHNPRKRTERSDEGYDVDTLDTDLAAALGRLAPSNDSMNATMPGASIPASASSCSRLPCSRKRSGNPRFNTVTRSSSRARHSLTALPAPPAIALSSTVTSKSCSRASCVTIASSSGLMKRMFTTLAFNVSPA